MKLSGRVQQLLGLACMLHFGAVGYLLGSAVFGTDADTSREYEGGFTQAHGKPISLGARFVSGVNRGQRDAPLAPRNKAPAVNMNDADTAAPALHLQLGHVELPPPPVPVAHEIERKKEGQLQQQQQSERGLSQQQNKERQQGVQNSSVDANEKNEEEEEGEETIYDEADPGRNRKDIKEQPLEKQPPIVHRMVKDRLLKMQWPMHLGFNNVRFQLEVAIYLASLLKRQLLAPARLRMRTCLDKVLCEKSRCVRFLDESWWCPTEMFLDPDVLKFGAGVLLVHPDDESIEAGLSSSVVPDAFDRMYAENAVWVERLPYQIRHLVKADHVHPPSEGNGSVALHYQRFDLGCELSYNHQRTFVWGDEPEKVEVHGFWDEFNSVTEDVLELQGEVLRVGRTPVAWASPDAVSNFRRLKTRTVQYHPEVKRLAVEAVEYIVGKDNTEASSQKAAAFTCVHLRRGDFVTAGWLGTKVGNISKVASSLVGLLKPTDRLYIATDETNLKVLQPLTDLGAVLWRDVAGILRKSSDTLMQYGDYVGLVEQMICAHAQTFIGSTCSSFTGGIYNLRAEMHSDYSKQSLGSLMNDFKTPIPQPRDTK